VFRRAIVPGLMLLAVVLSLHATTTSAAATKPINFTRGTLTGAGFTTSLPTSLAFGPDGRLYVANQNGTIQALTVADAAGNTKTITAKQQLTTDADVQEVYGITFDPSDGSLWITNTVSGFGDAGQAPAGTFLGKVTRLSGANFATRTDVITGLPVSNSGHEANGLAFGPDGRLYIAQGSTTNAGIVNPNVGLFQRPEVPTSAAVLVADVHAPSFNGAITYSPANTYSDTVDQTGGDVSVYAPGFRNPYDLVFHSNGKLYLTDNGPNSGYGPPSTSCSTQGTSDANALDELNIVVAGNYYGHPNRNRGRTDARQCVYHAGTDPSGGGYTAPLEANLPASSDGLVEYTNGVFDGQLQGDLLYVSWVENTLHRVKLANAGTTVFEDTTLATGFANPLDVAVGADGTIYVAEYGGNKITFLKPDTTPATTVSVTGVQPNGGPIGGGQAVTITGANFTTTAETTVTFDGIPATNVKVQNATTINATTPAHAAGAVNVAVTNTIGTGTLANGYNYVTGGGTQPPIANAGPDQSTPIAHENHAHVTLDGRNSFDPDGFIVSYQWTEGATVLSMNSIDSVQLTQGEHIITLTVTDNDGYTDTDDVRIIVTATAENPKKFFCGDVSGDGVVTASDLGTVAAAFGKKFGDAGYSRLKDFTADRIISAADLGGVASTFGPCSALDMQIRAATVAMEQYQDIRVAEAAGFTQITPFIPGQGRHMVKGSIGSQDATFDPSQPESLLYEPDSSTPGGWRLGGAMFIMPINLVPLPPDGFIGNEDAWHYHTWLCLWNNFNSVAEGVPQSTCLSRSGNPVWIEKAGWLVHLWNYVPNPTGRFVEVNTTFGGLP